MYGLTDRLDWTCGTMDLAQVIAELVPCDSCSRPRILRLGPRKRLAPVFVPVGSLLFHVMCVSPQFTRESRYVSLPLWDELAAGAAGIFFVWGHTAVASHGLFFDTSSSRLALLTTKIGVQNRRDRILCWIQDLRTL